jgi:MGT family glycosyltransferase
MTGSDFLLITWQGGGNLPPELGLARRLIQAGHRVRVLSEPSVEADAKAVGCQFTSWPTAPAMNPIDRELAAFKDWNLRGRLAAARHPSRLFGVQSLIAHDVLRTLERHPADALIIDALAIGAFPAAERAGLPRAAVLPSIYIRPTPGHPVLGPGWLPAHGPAGRARDVVAPWAVLKLLRLGLPRLNKIRLELDLPRMNNVLDMWDDSQRLLVMTSPTFDPPPTNLPDNVRYVGPLTDDPPWAAPWTPPWPLNTRPFVLVGMSSTYQAQERLLRRLVTVLDGKPLWALVTRGPGLYPAEVVGTSNVAVADSAPHHELLPHADLFVTHAGHGSTIKALAAGTPMVCIPHGRDQNDNAARVVAAGAGVRLSRGASDESISAAIRKVLTDSSYKANAHRLANAIAAEAIRGPHVLAEVEQLLTR